jgi:adsorption protein B
MNPYWLLWLSLAVNLSSFDDLLIDLFAIGIRQQKHNGLSSSTPKIGVFIANWQEADIIPVTIPGNISEITDPNVVFYVGVYPNDTPTLEAARKIESEYPDRVKVIVNRMNGPTTKGQLLNHMFLEVIGNDGPDIIVFHDSEDKIDPRLFQLYASLVSEGYDYIQTPVFSLPSEHRSYVGASYEDMLGEFHTRIMVVREALGVAIPSAGVGTAFTKQVAQTFINERGEVLADGSVVEDYIFGHECHRKGFRCTFVNVHDNDGHIATWEFFPSTIATSVKQKSRWIYGIAFDAWRRLGWYGGLKDRWFLMRDRKAMFTAFLAPLSFIYFIGILIFGIDDHHISATTASILWWSVVINMFACLIRYWVRVSSHNNVYGNGNFVGIVIRWFVSLWVDALATARAWKMFLVDSSFATRPVAWAKTTHEVEQMF